MRRCRRIFLDCFDFLHGFCGGAARSGAADCLRTLGPRQVDPDGSDARHPLRDRPAFVVIRGVVADLQVVPLFERVLAK